MTRFQLVFRRTGSDDESEFRYKNDEGAPHIDGTIILDGDRYAIRGVEWLVRREDHHGTTWLASSARSSSSPTTTCRRETHLDPDLSRQTGLAGPALLPGDPGRLAMGSSPTREGAGNAKNRRHACGRRHRPLARG
jgi:hypothetical protein